MAKHHEILDISFSNSTPWVNDQRNIVVTTDLGIEDGYKVSMKVELKNAEKSRHEILSETMYTHETMRKFSVERSLLTLGKNTLWITFKDELEDGGETEFSHDITVEDRNCFLLNRDFVFKDEFNKTGKVKFDSSGMTITSNGFEESVVIPKESIMMEGRAKVKSIKINSDDDIIGSFDAIKKAEYRIDRGDSIVQRIPLKNIKTFDTVLKLQMTDKKGVE